MALRILRRRQARRQEELREQPDPPRSRRILTAVAATVGTTLVGAVAAAVITPDRVNALLGHQAAAAKPAVTAALHRVATADQGLSLSVPAAWSVTNGSFDWRPLAGTYSGSAVDAGTDIDPGIHWGTGSVYAAASRSLATQAGFARMTRAQVSTWLEAEASKLDWTKERCTAAQQPSLRIPHVTIAVRAWTGCADTATNRVWEVYGVSEDRSTAVALQIFGGTDLADRAALDIARSVSLIPAKLP